MALPAFADSVGDDDALPSVLSLSGTIDNSDSKSFYFDSDLAIFAGLRLSVGAGNNANATSRLDVKTNSYHTGLSSNPLNDISFGIDYEHWGEDKALLTDTWRIDLTVISENWSVRLAPAHSTITGYTRDTTLVSIPPQFDIDSDRYDGSISYFSPSDWNVTAGYTYFNYSRDVSKVATSLLVAAVLSPETLQLISVLDKRRYLLSFGFNLDDDQVGLDCSRMVSALDGSYYTTVSLFYSKPFATHWAADVSLGQQRTSNNDTINFMNLVLNYFW